MSIADLGSLGEFISSIAVLGTLIYLATQVRLARAESATNSLLQRTSSIIELFNAAATSDSLAESLSMLDARYSLDRSRSFIDRAEAEAGLTRGQAQRAWWWISGLMRTYVTHYETAKPGQKSDNDTSLLGILGSGYGRMYWDTLPHESVPSSTFVEHVTALLARNPPKAED
jgi:hypothetical protein